MGNSGSRAPALLGKTRVPDFEWKIHDFSALVDTKATSVVSGPFHCCGHQWSLKVSPMHTKPFGGTPYVALGLLLQKKICMEKDHTVHAVFELSIYNHSDGMYCGAKVSHSFDFKNYMSNMECLIPLQELLRSSDFLVDDSCVFGVEILKLDVSSPEKKSDVVQKKATTVQNLFVQKKGFIKGTYTWTMNNFLELDSKHSVRSRSFKVGGHEWHISMYPCGDKYSTDCLSLSLHLHASDDLPPGSGMAVEMTLSILDQKNGKHFSVTSGLVVFSASSSWGWSNFFPLKNLRDPSGGYLIESNCVVKADFTIFGSSNHG
ncbi:uncharacterized protein [Lolium perenne]|uniref:uncharacterized protein n=1 Tax=Lolium perenne TaxID=4522 RepID=UPI0021EAE4CB|nr:uncharacterized protein LOC127302242 isoform X1 [Lolium perenne]XP_051188628.1 uncharacterized protein LOC127302242 isoform X1 [Lolium perenne]XP_051188629.1 uncharacterized protein LOC127302242 isoform X2 [Lolium perenne]